MPIREGFSEEVYADPFNDDLEDVSARLDNSAAKSVVGFMWGLAISSHVYTVLPSLKEAYEYDNAWRARGGRQQFRADMKADAIVGAQLLA